MPRKPHTTHSPACLTDFYGKIVCKVLGETVKIEPARPAPKTTTNARPSVIPISYKKFRKLVLKRHGGSDKYIEPLWNYMQQKKLAGEATEALREGTFDESWIPSETWCSLTFDLPASVQKYVKAAKSY